MKLDINRYEMQTKDVEVKGKFINRELSWIDFNYRVLYCAKRGDLINERLNFLGITTNNLDEFLSVRFAGAWKSSNKKVYKELNHKIHQFIHQQVNTYEDIKDELKKKNVNITKMDRLDKKEIRKMKDVFFSYVFPILTPISADGGIPNLSTGDACIAVNIIQGIDENLVIVPIPKSIDYLFEIGDKVILVEDLVSFFLKELFINKEIKSYGIFRIINDASFCLSHDEHRFIIDRMTDILTKRKLSTPVFVEIESKMDEKLKERLIEQFNIPKSHIHEEDTIVDFRRFSKNKLLSEKYSYKPFRQMPYEGKGRYSLFSIIDDKDILLHHPYDDYSTVVRFINHAAVDPDVVAIKQTLYRVSSIDSPIVKGLCKAAENGKQVSVLVEIKARFDEENNLHVIERLEASGCRVLLGTEFLKTHCKMCVVVKKDGMDYRLYSHVATGNYNEKTSKIYTDLSYFTSKQKIGMDLLLIFNILSGISTPDSKLKKIAYSPVTLRKTLLAKIEREVEYAKKGKRAEIFIKVNSISDPIMVQELYKAAEKGVKIYIVCRGVCSIVARKNIFIKSIVGRFLEHSRIYYFYNNGNPDYYISSADLLTRNLDRRIEILLSLTDSSVTHKIKSIIKTLKSDEANSFVMDAKGIYHKSKGKFNSHDEFIRKVEKIQRDDTDE